MRLPPSRFHEIRAVIDAYDRRSANFTIHLWPCSHPDLHRYLVDECKVLEVIQIRALMRSLDPAKLICPDMNRFRILEVKDVPRFVESKIRAWQIHPNFKNQLIESTYFLLNDSRHETLIVEEGGDIVGGVSSFQVADQAYLRGAFVVPERRKEGLYADLMRARSYRLANVHQVRVEVAMTQPKTSTPQFLKQGFTEIAIVPVFARIPNPWVSL